MSPTIVSFFLCLLLLGCANEPPQPTATPNMTSFLTAPPGADYRIYDSFEALQPMLELHNDTTYVINFWATWCKPCITEMPHFKQLAEAYRDKTLTIVLISLDDKEGSSEKLSRFRQQQQLDLPIVLLDAAQQTDWQKKLDKRWDGTLPATLIYKNQLRFFANQAFSTYFDLEQMVSPLVK